MTATTDLMEALQECTDEKLEEFGREDDREGARFTHRDIWLTVADFARALLAARRIGATLELGADDLLGGAVRRCVSNELGILAAVVLDQRNAAAADGRPGLAAVCNAIVCPAIDEVRLRRDVMTPAMLEHVRFGRVVGGG